jgi:hypothetical protein
MSHPKNLKGIDMLEGIIVWLASCSLFFVAVFISRLFAD